MSKTIVLLITFFSLNLYAELLPFGDQVVEVFVQKPTKTPSPLLVLLHGSSGNGREMLIEKHLKPFRNKGYAIASISMPGYGESSGEIDFCGSNTLAALNFAVDQIIEQVGSDGFGVIGFGQGAVAGLLLATSREDMKCIVCSNGAYDLVRHRGDRMMQILERKGHFDIHSETALICRSPLHLASTIKTPSFLLHREGNPMIFESEVLDFQDLLVKQGVECQVRFRKKTLEAHEQRLTFEELLFETAGWIHQHLHEKPLSDAEFPSCTFFPPALNSAEKTLVFAIM